MAAATDYAKELLRRQFLEMSRNPPEGVSVGLGDDDNIFNWEILLVGPPDTLYEGGFFKAVLEFPSDFPNMPPKMTFKSEMWHPNVYPNGVVCISILHPPGEDQLNQQETADERWRPILGVESILVSVISMLSDPNDESPANIDAALEWRNDKEGFKKHCRRIVRKSQEEIYAPLENNPMVLPLYRSCAMSSRVAIRSLHQEQRSFKHTHTLVLIRHGESEWNRKNLFTGWYDVQLSEKGNKEAAAAGQLLKQEGYRFDVAYTSYLKRAIRTLWHVLEQTDQMWIPVHKTWRLNERHYGALTGLDKQATVEKHGAEKVLEWRRSYNIPPPDLDTSSEYYPSNDIKYKDVPKKELPRAESLELTATRVLPEWEKTIVPIIKAGKNVVIAAHGNSLRALVKHLDNISEDEITGLNIPTGAPLVYHLDENLKPIPHKDAIKPLNAFYLGDQDEIRARILGVKNQTK
ncbi:hypothetical protein PsorP6_004922 [Peronosclerospora sorghi]|uniref:Uncharacterized protein n=1 Tax=Peronosclerospora sorghi TaxID=230839 RepID=A0ACC0W7W1_9STRA|nr:hypothetical protein PsorP6_004922 [Peronosclerospora sorghi]